MRKTIKILFLSVIPFNLCFSQKLNETYSAKVDYKNSDIYEKYDLIFKEDNNFQFSRFNYQICYSDSDTIRGTWKKEGNKIHFYNIDNNDFIKKENTDLNRNEIEVRENCVYSYEQKNENHIFILSLNDNFNPIKIISPNHHKYDKESKLLKTRFTIPENSAHLIYIRRFANSIISREIEDLTFFNIGIELSDFNKSNTFNIENCHRNQLPEILNPYFTLIINEDGTLISEKEFYEMDGKLRFRKFNLQK